MLKKKYWASFQRIIELFTQKIVNELSKIWVWDPGSGNRYPEKTYSGSRGQKGTESRIRIRNTAPTDQLGNRVVVRGKCYSRIPITFYRLPLAGGYIYV